MTNKPTDDDHSLDLLIPKLRALRLPGMARVLPTLLAQAKADNLTDLEILHRLCDEERASRLKCGIRTIPIAETGGWRSPKPDHGDHRNRAWRSPKPGIPITETGDGDRLTSVVRPLPDLR